ncbi:glycerophosphodiester phosphodiesterase family protein [Halobellus sp. GM3]|uniref:glycerophosphodiester phosphodiesterase family protein n=1 Tax=Halobellus sp. GM3 TaxID=3458410 RepID=UPI00403E0438
MELIGHRGCAMQYPENTVGAVSKAAQYVGAVEVDVRRCATGELVVFHDETVDRLTEGTGRVAELPWETLSEYEVLESGETVPRLSGVLDAVPETVDLQIELKETGLAADVRAAVAGTGHDVTVSSFLPGAIEEVNASGWTVPTGYLFESEPDAGLETALELSCAVVHPHYDLCLSSGVVESAHDAGLRVVAWKAARTAEEVRVLESVGVDAVTADRWDIA